MKDTRFNGFKNTFISTQIYIKATERAIKLKIESVEFSLNFIRKVA
jgi:hypothetical protein